MKKINLLAAAAVSSALLLGPAAWAAEVHSEPVQLGSLPSAVQKTINEKAAGGKIVSVQREDDVDGRWNYEVVVQSSGKEWGFEVNPKGKFVRKHTDHAKTQER
jgi:hypothetical protein